MPCVPCKSCGAAIQPETAARNGGLCMPCKGSYRGRIERGKLRREEERRYEQSAERRYWLELVAPVEASPSGFDDLPPVEQTYFALESLIREVHDGGLNQYFFNSSGSTYQIALDGLIEIGAQATARLLVRAKELLFGSAPVPRDTTERRGIVAGVETPDELDELDGLFYEGTEELVELCRRYAARHGLYEPDEAT